MDIRHLIDTTRMSTYQWFIIGLASFLNALDGYDLVAMAFTSSAVSEEFALTGAPLGWLLSAALIGIGLGSLFLAPLADRYGRKTLILAALAIDLLGLTMSALADSFTELLLWRVVTGIGVGGILACVTVVVSEFSNLRFRGLAISIYSAGYGLGASLCGVLAAQFIPVYGWRSIFAIGAALTAASLALTAFALPESVDYLRGRGEHAKVRAVARRIGKTGEFEVREAGVDKQSASIAELFRGPLRATTIKLWIAFSLITAGFQFANQWTPKLLTEYGLSAQQGIIGGIMLSFGGTIGSLLFGSLTTRIDARRVLTAFTLLSAVVLVGFVSAAAWPTLMFALGVGVGMLLNGCVTGMYTVTPQAYPAALRTTGVGSAIGIARGGAVLAPIVVGYLLDAGWSPTALYSAAAVLVGVTALVLVGVREYTAPVVEREGVRV
ncbi:benzoate transport [Corynebacterium pollutisoli]|uniref:Benzoate transport n=1 Tax=Corynebacterium pollutisoli TaxID=1610489 RepID=A0A1X7HW66_9CORY|nr:MFS transporter [Corynebacterium pollutisoli]SMG06230.1 benzoate transport [Corynebacterium pollutisoli]